MHRPRRILSPVLVLLLAACGGSEPAETGPPDQQAWERLGITKSEGAFSEATSALDEVPIDEKPVAGENYEPVFPPPIPFDPSEWKTNPPPPTVAVPDAPHGGELRLAWLSFPPTLRTEGPNSRLSTLSDVHNLVYETLLGYDVVRGDYVPVLATHWWISDDKLTYRFRIDPEARWSDGTEVTADDVVATIEHLKNPDRKDPAVSSQWNEYIESAKMLDKLTVEIRAKKPYWRTMVMLAFAYIYPAAYIRMDGQTYLEDWNWRLPPGSGPYELRSGDMEKEVSLTLTRRRDWWQGDRPENRGTFNFDRVKWIVVRDQELMYQKFLAGELDLYLVGRAQRWVEELDNEPSVRQGRVQMRKIYSRVPEGYGGYCFNMRNPPFDDVRVREAFAHLFNREKLFAKFFFFQYEYIDSYFPGQPWARPDARRVHYRPERARELLADAGWTHRNADGWLVNDAGERFPTLTLEYPYQSWTRIHSVFQNDLKEQAGIELELKVIDSSALLKKVWEYQFQLVFWSWTAGIFPNPEFQFHSKYANRPQTNNLNGFANERADEIMDAYKVEFDAKKRVELLQELDRILFDAHPYALNWYAPFFRIIYWDRYGHPPEYAAAYTRDVNNVIAYWWLDPGKKAALEAATRAGRGLYPDRPLNQAEDVDQTWWVGHEEPMKDDADSSETGDAR